LQRIELGSHSSLSLQSLVALAARVMHPVDPAHRLDERVQEEHLTQTA
jgi:hypothetical protein